ncbi:vegetative insecticidal protein Vip3A family protein [Bacillus thuringiensis]|nr:vegetative insecticidal protein Vip3A family protein [Bacillus thuringiensis]
MTQNTLCVRALPSFIDEFNGIFGFGSNIASIIETIFGTEVGNDNVILEEILKNQELLNIINENISEINGSLNEIIANGNANSELLNDLINISNAQGTVLTNIQDQISSINSTLNYYLGKMTQMLNTVIQQNSVIILQIQYLSKQLEEISKKLDTININVLVNSTLTEISPSYQRMKYVNNKFDELSITHTDKFSQNGKNSSNVEILETATPTDLTGIISLIEFAKSVTKNDMNSFEFYLKTFHDVMVGKTIFERSALQTARDLIKESDIQADGSEVGKTYNFLIVLSSLLCKSYATIVACRKILCLPNIDYTPIINQCIQEQTKEFKENVIPYLSSTFTTFNHIDLGKGAAWREAHICDVKASPGYALVAFEVVQNGNDFDLIGYQAKLKSNYGIDKESVSKVITPNINKIIGPRSGEKKPGEEETISKHIYFNSEEVIFPEGYVITNIKFKSGTLEMGFHYEVTACLYDPITGEIDTNETLTEMRDANPETEISPTSDNGVYFPNRISDIFFSPMRSFQINGDPNSHKFSILSTSYLSEYLVESDLINKETSLIFLTKDITANTLNN